MKRPKLPQDLPMKVALTGLLALSLVQWLAKAAVLDASRRIKGRKKFF